MDCCYFELADPLEPDLPRYVGWGAAPTPWIDLWARDYGVEPKVAAWFKDLRQRETGPLVGRCLTVSTMGGAHQLVRFRISQIIEWCGGRPSWLLNMPNSNRPKRVVREVDGQTEVYKSIGEASQETGSCREDISLWSKTGLVDKNGAAWWFEYSDFDDFDGG